MNMLGKMQDGFGRRSEPKFKGGKLLGEAKMACFRYLFGFGPGIHVIRFAPATTRRDTLRARRPRTTTHPYPSEEGEHKNCTLHMYRVNPIHYQMETVLLVNIRLC